MGRGITNNHLTKDYVLSKVSQITIFNVYFDIPIKVINHCIETGELIRSPLREDSHPTCGFRYDNRGKLKFRDFAGYFWGDCFDAVALVVSVIEKRQLNISNKKDFFAVLQHIAFTFKDIFYGTEKDEVLLNNIKGSISLIRKQKPNIELVVRQWNKDDIRYWSQFNIPIQLLNICFVYPIDQYYIDRKVNPEPKYYYNTSDPCYAYWLGNDRHGNRNIKLYFPKRSKNTGSRFICNCNILEGLPNINKTKSDIIIITKSTKDRISIIANLIRISSLYGQNYKNNIHIVNIPHETYKLRDIEYNYLQSLLNTDGIIASLMDNDRTGMCEARYLRNKYKIIPIMIPKEYKAKDFAELVQNNKPNIVNELVLTTINKLYGYIKTNENIRNEANSSPEPF